MWLDNSIYCRAELISHFIYIYISFSRDYVQRAYATAHNEIEKDRIEQLLKDKIENACSTNTVGTIDWSKEPLPG